MIFLIIFAALVGSGLVAWLLVNMYIEDKK